ncbi:MAG TPA: DEAD/DEAH box helicase [Dongiaceae bacterium]
MTNTFDTLSLIEPIRRALATENYTQPTPIQTQAIPHLLAGRDLLGIAQTGTGKTAAFALPILQRLFEDKTPAGPKGVRALILTPTRELAIQIGDSFRTYGKHLHLRQALVYGGVGQKPQVNALARGVDILVATPGRLLDLMGQGHIRLDAVQIFVLDEADRMLDMGFIHDVRRIAKAIRSTHQSLLFSATMPNDIADLAGSMLKDPVRVEVTPVSSTVELVDQRVLFVDNANKRALLTALLGEPGIERVLVFTRTKHGANKVAEHLERSKINADAIHGNKTQGARQRALENFRSGRSRVLVATDIAARGIDIDGITHVVNFDLPNIPESYVHRIGRTARAGASGTALSFCGPDERGFLRDIERLTRHSLSVISDHPFVSANAAKPAAAGEGEGGRRSGNRGGGNRNGGHRAGGREGGHRGNGQGRGHGRRHEGGHHQDGQRDQAAVVSAGGSGQAENPRNGQHRPDRPRDEKRRGEHRRGEHHRSERHAGERAKGGQRHEHPRGERPHGERNRAERPQGERHADGNRDDRSGLNKMIGGAR